MILPVSFLPAGKSVQIVFFVWVTLSERKWSILAERRSRGPRRVRKLADRLLGLSETAPADRLATAAIAVQIRQESEQPARSIIQLEFVRRLMSEPCPFESSASTITPYSEGASPQSSPAKPT